VGRVAALDACSQAPTPLKTLAQINEPTPRLVAHALVRAVFALFGTQASGIDHSVHTSVNAARNSACATRASRPMIALPSRDRKGAGCCYFFRNFSTPRFMSSVIRAIAFVSTPASMAASKVIPSI
jgi:hypothetical protein